MSLLILVAVVRVYEPFAGTVQRKKKMRDTAIVYSYELSHFSQTGEHVCVAS